MIESLGDVCVWWRTAIVHARTEAVELRSPFAKKPPVLIPTASKVEADALLDLATEEAEADQAETEQNCRRAGIRNTGGVVEAIGIEMGNT